MTHTPTQAAQAIQSRDNPKYKQLAALLSHPRDRRQAQQTVLEGIHLGQVCVQQGYMPRQIWATQSALQKAEVLELLKQSEVPVFVLAEALFAAISTVENGIGLLCVVDIPEAGLPEVIQNNCVLLDRVQDPGNLGTLLRTAAAAGHDWVFCGPGCADPWSPKVLRAAMGAHFYLQIAQGFEWNAVLSRIQIPILATDLAASTDLYDLDLHAPGAWLFGNEGSGLSTDLLQRADQRVRIPQPGVIESLNVSAAAAICLFEQVRQQRVLE